MLSSGMWRAAVRLERALDMFERQAMRSPTAVTVEYRGEVDLDLLTRAFEVLCTRHPVLRARVHDGEGGPVLRVPPASEPSVVVHGERRGRESLGATARSWDVERAVAQLDVVPAENGGVVALFTDHAVADGRSKHALFNELWALYTTLHDGGEVSVEPGSALPSPPSALFDRYLGQRDEGDPGEQGAPTVLPPEARSRPSYTARRRYLTWSTEWTAGLVAAARQAGTTVTALLCGAILTAQRRILDPDGDPVEMACWAPVDYRDRVEPPVGATAATNFGAPQEILVSVGKDADPVQVGREVKAKLDAALVTLPRPEGQLGQLFSQLSRAPQADLSKAAISNSGIVAPLTHPASVQIVDWRVLTYHIRQTYPIYTAHTYQRRLVLQFVYPAEFYPDEEMERLEAGIVTELEGMLRRAR